jgi:glycosyltransferase involved in cell wall biosynthesis/lipopolysaccharide biosynthesis protein
MKKNENILNRLIEANQLFRQGNLIEAKKVYNEIAAHNELSKKIALQNLGIIEQRLKRDFRPSASGDHALVIHVWHLDVLDELAEAVLNLPEKVDQYLTIPAHFGSKEKELIKSKFPHANQVSVENLGQDVGALFQLMKKVDLCKYKFICKIHTKKGENMPDEWRRALLDGVLGSVQQVQYIIKKFREDSKILMAGSRQLYLHGPSYLFKNKEIIESVFKEKINDFNFLKADWWFIAGTCFWIRTSILKELENCELSFQPSEYVVDGTIAHATERMFGMQVAIHAGKVLLQDLTLPERMPDEEIAYPSSLPRKSVGLIRQLLTPLVANGFINLQKRNDASIGGQKEKSRRIAVFASYSEDGVLPLQVIPYIKGLREVAETIVLVCDNDLVPDELEKIHGMVTHVITGRHGEYDFGSYKRGIAWAIESGHLKKANDLILCNDSCFGPINSFVPMFNVMDARNHDFWGVTDSYEYSYHIQSYFLVFSKSVFESPVFLKFFKEIKKQESVKDVIQNYELGLTRILKEAGFQAGALVNNNLINIHAKDNTYSNSTVLPLYTFKNGSPLIKVKALKYPYTNLHGANQVLHWIEKIDRNLYEILVSDIDIVNSLLADDIKFSLILATYNRAHCIENAIRSVLCQTHRNFEIVIVDDGSTDGTRELIEVGFQDFIKKGFIRYIRLENNFGVCAARNIGLAYAKNPWIGYIDSDNAIRPYMLTVFANAIVKNPDKESFYAKFFRVLEGKEIGKPFDRKGIVSGNFIDLGVYVHSKSLAQRCGGFDQSLRRLVDWEMIIRHTKEADPVFIPRVCLDYDDEDLNLDRISVRESSVKAHATVWAKHNPKPTISTIIVSYNHEDYISEAIESALSQRGDFNHEILLADDGSSDRTTEIIERYVKKYIHQVRSIGRGRNFGVSENYRYAFSEAGGQFIAILEGDDYWTDTEKLIKQASFLKQNEKASMVLSRIELFDMQKNSRRLLKRQEGLPSMLSAKHFADDKHLNLIVNLSCCMFRSAIMKRLPEVLYHPRLSEIALAFYHDRLGEIGFLPEVMSTYRINDRSVWSGASAISKHQQAIDVRECALRVARPIYRATIQQHIDQRRKMLDAEIARQSSSVVVT